MLSVPAHPCTSASTIFGLPVTINVPVPGPETHQLFKVLLRVLSALESAPRWRPAAVQGMAMAS